MAQAQVVRVSHAIHACSERYSSTLSSPFHPTSSSISFRPCCTSSTFLRAVATRRTPPKRIWSLLMSLISTHKQDAALRTCHTRKHIRVWLKRSSRFGAFFIGVFSYRSQSHRLCSRRTLDRLLLPLPHSTPSPLYFINWNISCNLEQ